MGKRIKKLKKIRIHREGTNELLYSMFAIVAIAVVLWRSFDSWIPFALFLAVAVVVWLLVLNFSGYSQTNEVRVVWSADHSIDQPWYISEVPTVGVSLNYTTHLIDVPQVKTFITAYGSKTENIRAFIEKMIGKSAFTGTPEDTVFCDRWETRV